MTALPDAHGSEATAGSPVAPPRPPTFGHAPALDGIRGLAVLLVVLSHISLGLLPHATYSFRIRSWVDGGWLGVDLFFVLSGFLITALLLTEQERTRRVRFGAFYARRALRLLPALYLLLIAFAFYTVIAGKPTGPAEDTIRSAVLYVNNWQAVWHPETVATGLGHLWSLAIEEQFYLVWPAVLVLVFGARRHPAFAAGGIAALIAVVAIRRAVLWDGGLGWISGIVRTDLRVDSLLVGALAAVLWTRGLVPRRALAVVGWIAAVVIGIAVWNGSPVQSFWYYGGFTLFALCGAVVLLATLDGRWAATRFFATRPMRLFGRLSYGIYLWHLPIFKAVAEHGADVPAVLRLGLALALTGAAVAASWHWVERPAGRLRRRFEV